MVLSSAGTGGCLQEDASTESAQAIHNGRPSFRRSMVGLLGWIVVLVGLYAREEGKELSTQLTYTVRSSTTI